MTDNRKISLCCTTFERFDFTIKCFAKILDDIRISEVILIDDSSTDGSFEKLVKYYEGNYKVKVYGNKENLNVYKNKHRAVSFASNGWTAIIDSDNEFDKNYLDKIFGIPVWNEKVSYMPDFASPNFDYREMDGMTINATNINQVINKKLCLTMLNCMNFFVNRKEYLSAFDGSVDPHTADSLYFNYCWFNRGNSMYVVPGMKYIHNIHKGSHYQLQNHLTKGFDKEIEKKLRHLK